MSTTCRPTFTLILKIIPNINFQNCIFTIRYHKTKLCQILSTAFLAPLVMQDSVTVNAINPGAVSTDIFNNSALWIRFITGVICRPFFKVLIKPI